MFCLIMSCDETEKKFKKKYALWAENFTDNRTWKILAAGKET